MLARCRAVFFRAERERDNIMSEENNNLENKELSEKIIEETIEETPVQSEEVQEETTEETVEEITADNETEANAFNEETAAETEAVYGDAETTVPTEVKKISGGAIAAIVAGVVALWAVVALIVFVDPFNLNLFGLKKEVQNVTEQQTQTATPEPKEIVVKLPSKDDLTKEEQTATKKYNDMYPNVTGIIIGEVVDRMGFEMEDFIAYYDLPEDITPLVNEYAAINIMPIGTYIEKTMGTDFATAAEFFGWGESVTEETPMGEAMDKVSLDKYYGTDQIDTVKAQYGFDDSVTGETLYGEIRQQVEQTMLEELEAQKAAEEASETAEEASETEE